MNSSHHQGLYVEEAHKRECSLVSRPVTSYYCYFTIECSDFWEHPGAWYAMLLIQKPSMLSGMPARCGNFWTYRRQLCSQEWCHDTLQPDHLAGKASSVHRRGTPGLDPDLLLTKPSPCYQPASVFQSSYANQLQTEFRSQEQYELLPSLNIFSCCVPPTKQGSLRVHGTCTANCQSDSPGPQTRVNRIKGDEDQTGNQHIALKRVKFLHISGIVIVNF